jgi:hypothetical protein
VPKRRPSTFRFALQAHAVAISGMSDSEAGKWFRTLLRDLDSGNPSTDVARDMIEHANQISDVRSIGGHASAAARALQRAALDAAPPDDPNTLSPPSPPPPEPQPEPAPEAPAQRRSGPAHVPAKENFMAHAAVVGLPDEQAKLCWNY